MINSVVLMGRLTNDPELKQTTSGVPVTSFRIAVDRVFKEEKKTDFITIVAWRHTAEFITKFFHKGSMIAVQGFIQTREFQDKNGKKQTAFEVVANTVSFCGDKPAEKISYMNVAADDDLTF